MFKLNDKLITKLERDLGRFADQALPIAAVATLNQGAFAGRRFAMENVQSSMIERNKFTAQSIRVEKATRGEPEAVLGSTAPYMATQEFGGTRSKAGKKGVPIATSYSSNEGMDTQPRKRVSVRANRLQVLRIKHTGRKGKTRAQRNLIAVLVAAESSQKFAFLDLGRRQGLFKIVGGKRKPVVRMVHDLTQRSVHIPRNPWLLPAVRRTEGIMPQLYHDALTFQAKRRGLFE